jgi:hypothetical protein
MDSFSILKQKTLFFNLGKLITDGIVNAVDPLNVSGHGFDARLLGPHVLVEEVVGLQVEHAGPLLDVNLLQTLIQLFHLSLLRHIEALDK